MMTTPETIMKTQTISASAEAVWCALLEPTAFKGPAQSVRNYSVISTEGDVRIAAWTVWLKGFELSWKERQTVEVGKRRIQFRQVDGMFAVYEGSWRVTANPHTHTVLQLQLTIDTGMPHLAQLINPVISGAFDVLAAELLDAVSLEALRIEPAHAVA